MPDMKAKKVSCAGAPDALGMMITRTALHGRSSHKRPHHEKQNLPSCDQLSPGGRGKIDAGGVHGH